MDPFFPRHSGLAAINPGARDLFADAAAASRRSAWAAYFPYLLFTSRKQRRILYETAKGSLIVYLRRVGDDRDTLSLFLPPMPFTSASLRHAAERVRSANSGRDCPIEWVEEEEALAVARANFAVRRRTCEFIYDREAVSRLDGAAFKRLRSNLALLNRYPNTIVRAYRKEDEGTCLRLLRDWRDRLQAQGSAPGGYRYTVNCLRNALALPADRLRGEVMEIAGSVRGFAFGGPISPDYGSVFITIADPDYPGLPYLLRHRMIDAFPGLSFFNDSNDNGRPGLADFKRRFRPVEMKTIYRARLQ